MMNQSPEGATRLPEAEFLAPRDFVDVESLVRRLKTRAASRAPLAATPGEPVDPPGAEHAESNLSEAMAAQAHLNGLIVDALNDMGEWLRRLDADLALVKQQVERGHSPWVPDGELNQMRTTLRLSMAMLDTLASDRGGGDDGQS